jgi:hypothetical protein
MESRIATAITPADRIDVCHFTRRIKMTKQPALLSAAVLLLGLAVAVPAHATPPPWAPAHGHRAKQAREYQYVYYPAQQVYYAPATSTWFWLSGGNWQFGINLPARYHAYAGDGVSVALHSSHPYVQHAYVEEHYGRPWREKHHYKHKEKHKHHKHGHGHDRGNDDHDEWNRRM